MKKRFIIISLLLVLVGVGSYARSPFIRFGAEWGPSAVLYSSTHLYYTDSDGIAVRENDSGFCFQMNGFVLGHVGVNATNFLSFSVLSGYAGAGKDNRLIPVLLRVTVTPDGFDTDGVFFFLDGGPGFHLTRKDEPDVVPAIMADAGMGYHFSLTPSTSLEFALNLKLTCDKELIPDLNRGGYIPAENIKRNSAKYLALCLSVGFSF